MISSQTMDASTPGGTGIPRARRDAAPRRCARMGGHESTDGDEIRCATARFANVPDGSPSCGRSLRAQLRQYWAVSRLRVWHALQTRVSWCGGSAGSGDCQSVQLGCADLVLDGAWSGARSGSFAAASATRFNAGSLLTVSPVWGSTLSASLMADIRTLSRLTQRC
jgi:hypothetical protein